MTALKTWTRPVVTELSTVARIVVTTRLNRAVASLRTTDEAETVSAEVEDFEAEPAFNGFIPAEFGPKYPALPSVAKFRKLANAGKADDGYGAAVLEGIRTLQRQELQRELKTHKSPCASGTWHTTGKAILKAVNDQNRAACARVYFDHHDAQRNVERYNAIMAAKREAAANIFA